jgi:hypothetical protein
MKMNIAMKLLAGCAFLLLLPSCIKKKSDAEETANATAKAVQFYADPAEFSTASGYVIASFIFNGKSYTPSTTKGACFDNIRVSETATSFTYKLVVHNYNSLDAMMQGLPYGTETRNGSLNAYYLKPGCNTIQIRNVSGFGYQLEVLP